MLRRMTQLAADGERYLERPHDPLGDALGGTVGVVRVAQPHGELVAAEAGDRVGGRTHFRRRSATATSSSSPRA